VDCHQDCLAALKSAEKFSASQKNKATYFEKRLLQAAFVEFVIFMLDVLKAISRFSLFSQTRSIPFPAVQSSLEKCVDRLKLLKEDTSRGAEWQKYLKGDYNHVLTQCVMSGQEHLSEATKVKILDILIDCVKQRCSDSVPLELDKLSPLLNITNWKKNELFSLDSVSSNGIRTWKVSDWMDVEIGNLNEYIFIKQQFVKQGIAVEEILVQWTALKRKLPTLDIDWEHPENISWEDVISQMSADHFINLIGLVDFLGTFCLSSAEAERGFSQLKVVKTDKRSRLQQSPLEDQLLAKLEGPSLDKFDPVPVIEAWCVSGARVKRPSFMEGQTSKFGPKPKKRR
jgi:hypothetical protein